MRRLFDHISGKRMCRMMTGENGRFAQHPAVQVFIARVGFYNRIDKRVSVNLVCAFEKIFFECFSHEEH